MGTNGHWTETLRQTLPSAAHIVRNLAPTFEVGGIREIDAAFLEGYGIRALIWDVDGTLTPYHAAAPRPDEAAHLERLENVAGLRQVILSNCGEARFHELGRMFPGVEVLKGYRVDSTRYYRWLSDGADRWEHGSSRPDGAVAIRKPDADLIRFALRRLGVSAGEAVMVGDQYWTDVAGANLAGVRSVKVPTLARSSFPLTLRVFQVLEAALQRAVT